MAASGSNQKPEKDRPSSSLSPSDQPPKRPLILIAEDSQADLFLIREAIAAAGIDCQLRVVQDGQQAVEYIGATSAGASAAPCPELILLDLNLPKREAWKCFATSAEAGRAGILWS
jgi:CheY-like chemotaxis protein